MDRFGLWRELRKDNLSSEGINTRLHVYKVKDKRFQTTTRVHACVHVYGGCVCGVRTCVVCVCVGGEGGEERKGKILSPSSMISFFLFYRVCYVASITSPFLKESCKHILYFISQGEGEIRYTA